MNKSFNLMQGKTGNYPGQEGGLLCAAERLLEGDEGGGLSRGEPSQDS